jgi:ABC-type Zn uptake system ZnuABC Zn-binding protein ZnuA
MHRVALFAALVLALSAVFVPAPAPASEQTRLKVVSTVAPVTNIVKNVGGERIDLEGIIAPGVDSHTFEPAPSDAVRLAGANLVVVNGLALEGHTIELAEANLKAGARILELGPNTITRDQWVFDFSFPEENGDPNPHVWMNPLYALKYAELVRDALVELDAPNADYYRQNTELFRTRIDALDKAIMATVATIPEQNRKLLTYHDSFAYFAPRYGFTVIGAIQPSDFAEPSPREVAGLIDQIRANNTPAIFGQQHPGHLRIGGVPERRAGADRPRDRRPLLRHPARRRPAGGAGRAREHLYRDAPVRRAADGRGAWRQLRADRWPGPDQHVSAINSA